MKNTNTLHIRLLGPLEIRRGKRLVELPSSKKARALLGYLIATGRKHRRDRLTELLWDVADDPKAGLRWCLTKIRPLVDDGETSRILADRETVEFSPEGAQIDVFVLQEKLKNGASSLGLKDLQALAGLFQGSSFLEGLDLPDYDSFQAWLVAVREDVLQQHLSVLRVITKELSNNAAAAVPYARLLVEMDPLDEHSRTQLCKFLMELGRQSEARQLLENGKRLAQELGRPGSPKLAEAERELSRPSDVPHHQSAGDFPETPVAVNSRTERSTFTRLVGREKERALLEAALLDSKAQRHGTLFLVTGEPGVGKTRLLAELAQRASSMAGTVLSGRSYEAEARRPYGPWIDAIQSLHPAAIGDILRQDLAPLLSGHDAERAHDPGDWRAGKDRLFASVMELLAARAHTAPPVLLQFDDIQWCDEASAELLHYVVRMTRHRPVSVILTARSGELPDNEAVMRVLRGFRRDAWLQEMELAPLSREQTARLVQVVAPSANPEAVFEETAGNPLYAIELARAADHPEKLADSTLAGLIRDRIDRLPPVASDVLKWAAILGTQFNLNRLSSVVAAREDELMNALDVLDRHGLLKASPATAGPPVYGFTHNVVRHAVYDDISEPRRRLMHRRIMQVLEKQAGSRVTAAEIVHHATLAGDPATAARASVAAGRHCLRVYANREALAFARSGIRYADALPEAERTGLQIELLEVSLSAWRPQDVEEYAKRLEKLAEQALTLGDVEHARLGFHLLSYLRWEGGAWSDAKRNSLRAESVARHADAKQQVVAMAETARCLALLERDLGQAEAMVLEARARATHAGVESVAIPDALGMLRFHQGEWDDAAGLFQSARDLASAQGDRSGEFLALEHLVVLELERNRPEVARALCGGLVDLGMKLREGSEAPFARCLAALALAACGSDCDEQIDAALESLRMADAKHRLAYGLLRAAEKDLERGNIEKARARGEEALRLTTLLERPSETAMAHLVLLRCALSKHSAADTERHAEALCGASMISVATHVRKAAEEILSAMKGARSGTGAG